MLLNQPTRLPFPYDQAIAGNYISDPNSYSFPTPPSGPEAAQHLQFIAASLCSLLQNGANQGPISLFAYNLFSHNRFNNDAWLAIVADTYDFATKLAQANPGSDLGQILGTAVQRYCQYAVANCMNRYPELQQVVPVEAVNRAITAVNNYRATVQQLDVHVQRMMAQQSNQLLGIDNLSRPLAQNTAIVGGNFESLMTNIVQENPGQGDGWRGKRVLSAKLAEELGVPAIPEPVKEQQPHYHQELPTNVGLVPKIVPKRRLPPAASQDSPAHVPAEATEVAKVTDATEPVEPTPSELFGEIQAEIVERPQFKVRETPRKEPDYTANPQIQVRHIVIPENLEIALDDMEELKDHDGEYRISNLVPIEGADEFGVWMTDEGELVKVVSPDNTGWNMSMNQLTRTAYNPLKWHRALVQQCTADNQLIGPVSEGFIPVKEHDPMDYLDLELDPAIRAKALAELTYNQKYIPVNGEVFEITSASTVFGFNGTAEVAVAQERQMALYSLNRTQRRSPLLACIELAAVLSERDSEFMGGACGSDGGLRLRIMGAESLLPSKPACSHPVWMDVDNAMAELYCNLPALAKQVDSMLTSEINMTLMHGFGLQTLEIESFYGDYEELLESIKSSHGEEASERLHEAAKALFSSLFWNTDSNTFIFMHESLSMHLHGDPTDYGIHLVSKDLGLAKLSNCQMLMRTLQEALAKFNFKVDTHPLYIGFSDGNLWRMVPSIWDENHLTLVRQ